MAARFARSLMTRVRAHGAWAIAIVIAIALGPLACGTTPPTDRSAPSVAGRWTGTYRVIACHGGAQACFGLRDSYAIRVELTQTDDGVSGTVAGDVPAGSINGAIDVTGSLDSSDTLHVRGNQPYIAARSDRAGQAGVEIDDWATAVDAAGNSMSGRFHLTIQFRTNNVYPDIWRVDAELVSLKR
jgi:hypothetical protein